MPSKNQRVTPVMLTLQQISVIDAIVQNSDYRGRSSVIRDAIMPVLESALIAMNSGKGHRAMLNLQLNQKKKFTEKMDTIAERSKHYRDQKGQAVLDLQGIPRTELTLENEPKGL